MPPDEPNDEERLEALPEDYDTPAHPATPVPESGETTAPPHLDDTHPATDTNIQQEELYDEGLPGAAEVSEPPLTGSPESADEPTDEDVTL